MCMFDSCFHHLSKVNQTILCWRYGAEGFEKLLSFINNKSIGFLIR